MVLTTCPAPELAARLITIAPFTGLSAGSLLPAARAARILTLKPSELFADKGSVLPGFCLVLSGRLEWTDTAAALAWVHPGRVAAFDILPATLRAAPGGAECLYVATAAFLDLIERCPAWTAAMIVAAQAEGIWR